jgi:integrase
MARRPRASRLETRTARLKLPPRRKPHDYTTLAPGIALGYRRNQRAGVWVVRVADGHGGAWTKNVALADDYEDADGEHVLTFWQAQDRARKLARGTDADSGRPATVAEALDDYERDLKARDGALFNARYVRRLLPPTLRAKPVALLIPRELRRWRDDLLPSRRPSSVNRIGKAFKAALNLAASHDARITNAAAWRLGLAGLPDAHTARHVGLPESDVRAIVTAAHAVDPTLGLLVETAATTGARPVQLARLEIGDLQDDRADPRLMMPSARKGKGRKRVERRPVPIPLSLAEKLRQAAGQRPAGAPLLTKSDGTGWRHADHARPFALAAAQVGLAVTLYALRHSSIIRALLAGVPTRVVAALHDTSVLMLERSYSPYILDHSDAIARRALLDLSTPPADNVVSLPAGRRA